MNKLAKLLLLVTVFAHSMCAFSVETDAKQQLKAKLAELKTYQANFTQTVVDVEGSLLQKATGKIVLQQPNKLYWELFEPNESVLLADGKNIWNLDPFLEQVVVYAAEAALENNPLILLTDPESSKWQEFDIAQVDSQFMITPRKSNSGIDSLRLVFKGNTLVELESQDGQQQKSTLLFSEVKQNEALAANTFNFKMPEGYVLDDQR